jgi:hypothetical protein
VVIWEFLFSFFELPNRAIGKRRIAVQVVRVEDRADIAQAVPACAPEPLASKITRLYGHRG